MAEISTLDVRRAAMDLLARREHGFEELISKLKRRFTQNKYTFEPDFSAEKLSAILLQEIQKLRDENLQSDYRLIEAYIRARSNRGRGPLKISAELRSKGLMSGDIKRGFQEAEIDWFSLSAAVAVKRFGEEALDLKQKAKRNRFLVQRGFSFDHIGALDSID